MPKGTSNLLTNAPYWDIRRSWLVWGNSREGLRKPIARCLTVLSMPYSVIDARQARALEKKGLVLLNENLSVKEVTLTYLGLAWIVLNEPNIETLQ